MVASLPETQRMAKLVMRYQEDLDPSEIAQDFRYAGSDGQESFAAWARNAAREIGAPRRGRTVMDDLEEQLRRAFAPRDPPEGFADRVTLHGPPWRTELMTCRVETHLRRTAISLAAAFHERLTAAARLIAR